MTYLARNYSTKRTPQSEPIPEKDQVLNNAGGYVFSVTDWVLLDRFLILGTEGGSYYVGEQKLTRDAAKGVIRCLELDHKRAVDRTVEISVSGRAPKNDQAIFTLALAMTFGTVNEKRYAASKIREVCRIGTHIFQLAQYIEELRGWGRLVKNGVAKWYTDSDEEHLARQVVKYQSRLKFSQRDILRLTHPLTDSQSRGLIFRWVTRGIDHVEESAPDHAGLAHIWAYEKLKALSDDVESNDVISQVKGLIEQYRLPREAIPTRFLGDPDVWESLLASMPMEAMVRNLATMTRVGLLVNKSNASKIVVDRLNDQERLARSRIHPIKVLVALKTYHSGHGFRSSSTWTPVSSVVKALDGAFYKTFCNVRPTGKNILLALDVSGSMAAGAVAGVVGLSPRDAAAAMALVTANTEPNYRSIAFGRDMIPFDIRPKMEINDVLNAMAKIQFGATDCAKPMLWAMKESIKDIDAFIIYTDSETWAGRIHPTQALKNYRKGRPEAKLAVVGMVSNSFSIADPDDAGQMDVVGFDTATPDILSQFIAGLSEDFSSKAVDDI